jgi:integrase
LQTPSGGRGAARRALARWREATIPQFPTRLDIDRLLAACDREGPAGARDYGVLLLLARLGLRPFIGTRSVSMPGANWTLMPLPAASCPSATPN